MTTPSPDLEIEFEEEEEQEKESFTPEESQMFMTLLSVGAQSKTLTVYGYKIGIRTLTTDEDLQVGLLLKKYDGTLAFERAYKTLTAAAATRSIDGVPLLQALSPLDDIDTTSVEMKFQKLKTYYPVVIDEIYKGLTDLEAEALVVLSRLGKISL